MKQLLAIISLFMFTGFILPAQDKVFEKPANQQLVVDNAGVFSAPEIQALTNKLNQFSNEKSTQILIYTTNDLQGYDVADFAQRLGQGWGIGQKGFDNGIVIVYKPKTSDSPGRVTIQTGYGIEPLIPDITAHRIVDNEMIPSFRAGKVYEGIDKAVNTCISLTKGEFTAANYKPKKQNSSGGAILFLIVFFVVIFAIMGGSKRRNTYGTGTRNSSLPFWLAMGLFSAGSHRSSGWGDFSSGSGSFGGGGSSFGGFGGGSFGGGGASGSW